ncbi:MAG: 3,4-dihydroxy-2-butanone-4-phosphate synthase [Arenimonas sp.]|nr:3,4-dihydroxy-2-butanone-4-phosphate synthase [Arenimonas sp.]
MTQTPFSTIDQALQAFKQGKMIIVVDDENRENEGDLVMPAQTATPEAINFMIRFGRGLVCAPISAIRAEQLQLPLQVMKNTESMRTAFTVSVDAKDNISTGISAADRAHTLQLLANPQTTADAFNRPGHIFPLIAESGGVFKRQGHTEASVDLAVLAGFTPAGVICEIINDDGSMARLPDLELFAAEHNLLIVSIADLLAYRKRHEALLTQIESAPLPTESGLFDFYVFRSELLDEEHMALVKGPLEQLKNPGTLVRIHSECFTGDVLGSKRCDCGSQLHQAIAEIEQAGSGIVIYLRQEGRGIGLYNKVKAYQLQDQGLDTVEANLRLGFEADMRDYTMAIQILNHFEINDLQLLTNNPDKLEAIQNISRRKIVRKALSIEANSFNHHYLLTKNIKFGHSIDVTPNIENIS